MGCSANPNNSPPGRIEQLVPITPGNNYYEAGYSEVWGAIGTHMPFNDTCRCDENVDNGAGISWSVTVPAEGTTDISHQTVFSPTDVVVAGEPIPTLSGWGFAVLIGLMAFLGVGILIWQRWQPNLANRRNILSRRKSLVGDHLPRPSRRSGWVDA